MGEALFYIGLLIMIVGGIWILVLAFQKSVLWGLGALFVPFVSLIFVIMHWHIAWKPFVISLGGAVLYGIGASMIGTTV